MTGTPPEAPTDPMSEPGPNPGDGGPRVTRDEVRDIGRLRRTVGPDRRIAGVAGGLARHLDIDPVILRVAFVVLVFFGGAGLLVYGACWLLLPSDGDDRAPLGLDERSRGVALILVGVVAALALLGDALGGLEFPWPLVVVAMITLLVLTVIDRRSDRPRPTAPPVPHQAVPGTGEFVPASQSGYQPIPPIPPAAPAWTPPSRIPHPRRRGPILFWFTLALAALGIGVLGIVDVAGAPVAVSAYPALVVATCGVMLLVGAFYGRAGGLILVGLLASLGMAGATAADSVDAGSEHHPTVAAAVDDRYAMDAGELTVDLTGVTDLEALDGRTIRFEAGAGRFEVILPAELNVRVKARAGLGEVTLFGEQRDGGGVEFSRTHVGGTDAPELTLDMQVGLGEIEVRTVGQAETTGAGR